MTDHTIKNVESGSGDEARESGSPLQGRRRLLRGGLAAAPVLMTLASRPALGGQWNVVGTGGNWGGGGGKCVAPSGFVSMPTSHPGKKYTCSGYTPDYWKNCAMYKQPWPSPYCYTSGWNSWGQPQQPTKFKECFSPCTCYSDSTTLLDVLKMGDVSPNDVARYCTAALLNCAANLTPVLSKSDVEGIWSEFASKGYFEPTAGVKWYHDDIVTYLQSTMYI
jgi:hypothetical protein